jgi:hypothetical protein
MDIVDPDDAGCTGDEVEGVRSEEGGGNRGVGVIVESLETLARRSVP